MPVFNAGRHLRAAVMSVLDQSERDWELLLIDDGSTDGAVAELGDIEDPRIRPVADGMNRGLAVRLNEAIDLARGKFFARMDQDDIAHPDRFSRQVVALRNNIDLDLVGARCVTISERSEIIGQLPAALSHEEICARPWLGFYLPHPTWMGRIEWFRRYRYACPAPKFCEDQELLLRSHCESRFAVVPEYLLAYRVRDRINLPKLLRTRWALCVSQVRYFLKFGQFAQIFLATVAMLVRIAGDLLVSLQGTITGPPPKLSPRFAISEVVRVEWSRILRGNSIHND
jgi:glycosyltransferase involved in cell wall biosynthesis